MVALASLVNVTCKQEIPKDERESHELRMALKWRPGKIQPGKEETQKQPRARGVMGKWENGTKEAQNPATVTLYSQAGLRGSESYPGDAYCSQLEGSESPIVSSAIPR